MGSLSATITHTDQPARILKLYLGLKIYRVQPIFNSQPFFLFIILFIISVFGLQTRFYWY